MASRFNSDSEIVVVETFMDPKALYDKQILTGEASEIVTEQGIKGFPDGIIADDMIQNMTRGCVTTCVGATSI